MDTDSIDATSGLIDVVWVGAGWLKNQDAVVSHVREEFCEEHLDLKFALLRDLLFRVAELSYNRLEEVKGVRKVLTVSVTLAANLNQSFKSIVWRHDIETVIVLAEVHQNSDRV